MNNISLIYKINMFNNMVFGVYSTLLGVYHAVAIFIYPHGIFEAFLLFAIFTFYSCLTFWFIAAYKLGKKQSRSVPSFSYLGLVFALLILPAHYLLLRMKPGSLYPSIPVFNFDILMAQLFDMILIPLIILAILNIFVSAGLNSKTKRDSSLVKKGT